ncbi:hypothetical protein D3C85_714980 [compost metagenome]
MQPRPAHDLVHQEGCTRHVAEIFQHDDEEEDDQNLRQEDQNAANPADQAVDDQALQQAVGHRRPDPAADQGEQGLDTVHRGRGPGEDRLEHDEQDAQQDRQPRDRVQQDAIDLSGQGVRPLGRTDAGLHDALGLAMGGADFCRGRRMPFAVGLAHGQISLSLRGGDQFGDAALARRHGRDHRRADLGRQLLEVDTQALTLGDVVHVEGQHHRATDLLQLQRQPQHQTQVGGVGDADHHVRRRLARQSAQDGVAGDFLVQAARTQGIGARQVQH